MMRLEEIVEGIRLCGVLADGPVDVVAIASIGSDAVRLTYRDAAGNLGEEILLRDREGDLAIAVESDRTFEGDGAAFCRASEAYRIRLAHLFDPMVAVHTSRVEPLPHQIVAVYQEMLPRQPLRFLLADDPGAGKTIMAGLLMRELQIRGDLRRCLVVCPGSLAVQWQDELSQKFHLPFEILTNDRIEASRTGNALNEMPLAIARLDKLSRDDALLAKLRQTEWDFVVCDEAHKMSASFFGQEIRETKRYRLGKELSKVTRHFLLMTATPHNGKEEDFQLFLKLLDPDRFEGRFRQGVQPADAGDLIRRTVKEDLLRFDGQPLFPERVAHTVPYPLSPLEQQLYNRVTDYVRDEFNRADRLQNQGRRGTVGFALTVLQRRLASSPEAVYQSLRRRRERLQRRLMEEQRLAVVLLEDDRAFGPVLGQEDLEDDLDDYLESDREALENEVADRATAARTVAELQAEILALEALEKLALEVRSGGRDRKWDELSALLQSEGALRDRSGSYRKLVIFTEHRDTLNYLEDRIQGLLGRPEAVVAIHGGLARDRRRVAEAAFCNDPQVRVLLATDAAGEGINLQRAHLMVNYDLPWNPNRLEQRFGRIHRIGQTEVCHLWNLVAQGTREGDVYQTLLRKIEAEQRSLKGRVFDVLGKAIAGKELRELLVEAIRYGERPEVRARMEQILSDRLDVDRLRELLETAALAHDAMDLSKVLAIRAEMERAAARRLQPHFIGAFFREAFGQLGGTLSRRESGRYEVRHVPRKVRDFQEQLPYSQTIARRYERICFDQDAIDLLGRPKAEFICLGHPLLEAVLALTLEHDREALRQWAVLVDPTDWGDRVRVLVALEHGIQDGRRDRGGRRLASKRMQYVELLEDGTAIAAGDAPHLDYRPVTPEERQQLGPVLAADWLQQDFEATAIAYAVNFLVPEHLATVRRDREERVQKVMAAVKARLTYEITYWDRRAAELLEQERAGKPNSQLNAALAQQRAEDLRDRRDGRMEQLELERRLSPLPPTLVGAAVVVPVGLLVTPEERRQRQTLRVEQAAMAAVMAAERSLGFEPRDVSAARCGYDIESRDGATGRLRLIEVKGRIVGAETVTVTRNEVLCGLNAPDWFVLALVRVPPEGADVGCEVRYVRRPFDRELGEDEVSTNFNWGRLWQRGMLPN